MVAIHFFYRLFLALAKSYVLVWGVALLVSALLVLSPLLRIPISQKELLFFLANSIGSVSLFLAVLFGVLAGGVFLLSGHEYVLRARALFVHASRKSSFLSLIISLLFFLVGSLYSNGIMLPNIETVEKTASLSLQVMASDIEYVPPLSIIRPTAVPTVVATPVPQPKQWGVAVQVDEHEYTMTVANDTKNASAQEIMDALNAYRKIHGSGALSWDQKLADYAKSRVDTYIKKGGLDQHAGFKEFVSNPDNFKQIGFMGLGENASWGYTLSGVHLIEWVYAGDAPHNNNQLNPSWTHVGIGVEGTVTNIIFGKK